jgi:hypothetical protein
MWRRGASAGWLFPQATRRNRCLSSTEKDNSNAHSTPAAGPPLRAACDRPRGSICCRSQLVKGAELRRGVAVAGTSRRNALTNSSTDPVTWLGSSLTVMPSAVVVFSLQPDRSHVVSEPRAAVPATPDLASWPGVRFPKRHDPAAEHESWPTPAPHKPAPRAPRSSGPGLDMRGQQRRSTMGAGKTPYGPRRQSWRARPVGTHGWLGPCGTGRGRRQQPEPHWGSAPTPAPSGRSGCHVRRQRLAAGSLRRVVRLPCARPAGSEARPTLGPRRDRLVGPPVGGTTEAQSGCQTPLAAEVRTGGKVAGSPHDRARAPARSGPGSKP